MGHYGPVVGRSTADREVVGSNLTVVSVKVSYIPGCRLLAVQKPGVKLFTQGDPNASFLM